MKIRERFSSGGISGAGPSRGSERAGPIADAPRAAGASDRVQISGRGVDIQRARSLALRAPDIRQEMVEEVLGQIGRGEYTVTGAEVAPRMIHEHLMDSMG